MLGVCAVLSDTEAVWRLSRCGAMVLMRTIFVEARLRGCVRPFDHSVATEVNQAYVLRPVSLGLTDDTDWDVCLTLVQTQAGFPLVSGKDSKEPVKVIHTYSKTWAIQGDGYGSVEYAHPRFRCDFASA
jgi:hypothetical protein